MSELIDSGSYRGNSAIKRLGVGVEWTPELLEEYMKCSQDALYFCENYIKIVNVDKGLMPWKPYGYQREMVRSMAENRYTICACARQSGKCVTGDSIIDVRFLDSKFVAAPITYIHLIFEKLYKYRLLYSWKTNYASFGKQIFEDLLESNQEAADIFGRLWRSASHHSKLSWWNKHKNKFGIAYRQRASDCAQTTAENVPAEYNRIQVNAQGSVDDDTHKRRGGKQEFTTIRDSQREFSSAFERNHGWIEQPILWENALDTSSRIRRQETQKDIQSENSPVNEGTLGSNQESRETRCLYEDVSSSESCTREANWDQAERKNKSKKVGFPESLLFSKHSSPGREETLRGNKTKAFDSTQRSAKIRRNQTKNERSLGSKKTEKFIESFFVDGFSTKSLDGVVQISESHKTIVFDVWEINTTTKSLKCADDHIVFLSTGREIFVKDLSVGDEIITASGVEEVTSVIKSHYSENMFDLGVAHNSHRYFTNGILSHNTTAITGFILWYILFHRNKTVALLANKGETAREILGRIQNAYKNLPSWLQQGVGSWNKGSFELENDSRVLAAATTSDAIRGYTINLLFIDEAAFVDNWDEFFTAVFPTISSGKTTKVCLVSTPNGLNHFYKIWQETGYEPASEKRNDYYPIKVLWNQVPGRDDKWKKTTLEGMGNNIEKFEQEFDVEFLGSSGTLISGNALRQLIHRIPLATVDGLSTYYNPEPGHQYSLIADTSRGKGLDYSAFSVVDITKMPYQQVCTFRNNGIPPQEYAEILNRVGMHYNMAAVFIELNDLGQQVSDTLYNEMGYENLLYTSTKAGRGGKHITLQGADKSERGITTTPPVKSLGCSVLKLLVEQKQLIVNDFHTIEELSRFSRKGSSWEAEPGCHDDLVMGLVLFSWLSQDQYFKELTDINTIAQLRERSEEQVEADLMPFGFEDNGPADDPNEVLTPESTMMTFEQLLMG